jgi:hypothetical protein
MLKVQVKISPTVIVEAQGATQKEVYNQLAMSAEVFGERECGLCKCKDIAFTKRNVDSNDYFEMTCLNYQCGARLSMGQSKQRPGELFPIRKLITSGPEKGKPSRKKGDYGDHRGWTKYRGKPIEEDGDE